MAEKHKGKAKHPASDHLRAAADALDEVHQAMAAKQAQPMQPQGQPELPLGPASGVSPLGGLAR